MNTRWFTEQEHVEEYTRLSIEGIPGDLVFVPPDSSDEWENIKEVVVGGWTDTIAIWSKKPHGGVHLFLGAGTGISDAFKAYEKLLSQPEEFKELPKWDTWSYTQELPDDYNFIDIINAFPEEPLHDPNQLLLWEDINPRSAEWVEWFQDFLEMIEEFWIFPHSKFLTTPPDMQIRKLRETLRETINKRTSADTLELLGQRRTSTMTEVNPKTGEMAAEIMKRVDRPHKEREIWFHLKNKDRQTGVALEAGIYRSKSLPNEAWTYIIDRQVVDIIDGKPTTRWERAIMTDTEMLEYLGKQLQYLKRFSPIPGKKRN